MSNADRLQSVRFRFEALFLLLVAFPFLAAWLWDSGLFFELQGLPRGEFGDPIAAVQRIAGWLLPLTLGSMFAYGISQTEADPRLLTMGRYDPRHVWLRRWLPIGTIFLMVAVVSAALLGWWADESMVWLVAATATATLFALVVGFVIAVSTGTASSVAALGTALIVAGGMFLPPLLGLPVALALSPGPLGWLRDQEFHVAFLVHPLIVVCVALAILWLGMNLPHDARHIRWIANFRGHDA